jgi:hypothetical protein
MRLCRCGSHRRLRKAGSTQAYLHGAELVARGRRGRRGACDGLAGEHAAQLVVAIALATGLLFFLLAHLRIDHDLAPPASGAPV